MSACVGPTLSGNRCPEGPIEGTDPPKCPIHFSEETKREHMAARGRRSAEARRERKEMAPPARERVSLRTEDEIQDFVERAAALVEAGLAPSGLGTDVKNLVSCARLLIDIRKLKRENTELRKLLKLKPSALEHETEE